MADVDLSSKARLVYGRDFQEGDTVRIGECIIGHIACFKPDDTSADCKTATVTINLSNL